ncbi:hypothetical protein [Orbus mooreae]|uniref:hypothetical protein n=1 Tax=Orbus mooreae TaxID=3074107 RepID=UPI00370DA346
MIINNNKTKFNFIDRLYRIILGITKFIAIYLLLSMAWSFSLVLVVIMLVILLWIHKIAKITDARKVDMPITPLDRLKVGFCKIKGMVEAKETVKAPLDERLCVGYSYQIYDLNEHGEEQHPPVTSEVVCKNFTLSADGHRVYVDTYNIEFVMLSDNCVEKIINNQNHIQHTLYPNDEVVVVADAVMDSNKSYKLQYTTKHKTMMIMKSEDMSLLNEIERKPQRLLNLSIFISAIMVSLIIMANGMWYSDSKIMFFYDLNQLFLGNFVQVFSDKLSFSISFPTFLQPLIHANPLFSAGLTIIGSFILFCLLTKLNNLSARKGFNFLNYIGVNLSLIFFIVTIYSLFSAIILLIFSAELIAIKLLIIWCILVIIGVANFIFFILINKLE